MKKLTLSLLILSALSGPAAAGEMINSRLPKQIKVDLQFRHRYEQRDNFDFNGAADDEDGFNPYRTRLDISLLPVDQVKVFTQFQDARIADDHFADKSPYENYMDVRQLYGEVTNLQKIIHLEDAPLSGIGIRGGRQELSYGAQRLIGGFNWSNVAQTFDAGKVTLSFEPFHLDVDIFGGGKTPNKSPREADDLYDGSANDRVGGYYATYKGIKNVVLENYLINRKTDKNISFGSSGSGKLDDYTFGARVKGKIPDSGFDYEAEAAKQWGEFKDLDVNGMMAAAILGYTFKHDWKPRAAFEFDYGSGDDDSSDGELGTFDNLFPTNHLFYGYMDLASLQNLNNYQLQLSAKPTDKLKLRSDLHMLYLDTSKDSLYNAGRGVSRTAAGSDVDPHVGNEVDLTAAYELCKYADVLVGYSHFFAGDYLEETGASDDGDFFYTQTTLKF
jgi:hypothetical protein